MLFEAIIRSLEVLSDVIEFGPVKAAQINTSVIPEAERDTIRILGNLEKENYVGTRTHTEPTVIAEDKTKKEDIADPNAMDEEEELTSRKAKLLAAKPRGGRYMGAGGMLLWLEENGWDFEAEERMYAAKDAAAKAAKTGEQKALPVIAEVVDMKLSMKKERKSVNKSVLDQEEEDMISKAMAEKGHY